MGQSAKNINKFLFLMIYTDNFPENFNPFTYSAISDTAL